jgi:hypothetical protein
MLTFFTAIRSALRSRDDPRSRHFLGTLLQALARSEGATRTAQGPVNNGGKVRHSRGIPAVLIRFSWASECRCWFHTHTER